MAQKSDKRQALDGWKEFIKEMITADSKRAKELAKSTKDLKALIIEGGALISTMAVRCPA